MKIFNSKRIFFANVNWGKVGSQEGKILVNVVKERPPKATKLSVLDWDLGIGKQGELGTARRATHRGLAQMDVPGEIRLY